VIQDRNWKGILIRRALTDREWQGLSHLFQAKEGDRGRHGADNRLFGDAVLWLVRAGAPWRDLPEQRVQRFPAMGKKGASGSGFSQSWAKILISNT
jgi:transposase